MDLRDIHPTTQRLLLARAARSIGQGALVVDFALYLYALHWTAISIGLLLSGVGLFGAGLSLWVGLSSDRLRRKPFLLGYESIALLCSLAALFTAQPALLAIAAILGGFGRGAIGAAGPFSPAEQAWLAENVAPERRGLIYSLNTSLGSFGMALGALCAMAPDLLKDWLGPSLSYRPLFGLVALASVTNLLLISQASETYHPVKPATTFPGRQQDAQIHREENRILGKLVLVNSLNGIAIGLTGPLISYWFALRFHVGPAAIAPVMAVTFGLTSMLSLLTGKMTERIGIIDSVVRTRLIGLILLALVPLMPLYWLAALVYVLRSAFYRSSGGAQQALTVGLVRDERRGFAVSLNAVSFQLPRSTGPTLAGHLFYAGYLALPFYAAALLQALYLMLYDRIFRNYEPPQKGKEELAIIHVPVELEH
jgi:predicted MFS family arabinose efflux permease